MTRTLTSKTVVLAMFLLACASPTEPNSPVSTVTIVAPLPSATAVSSGSSVQLTAIARDSEGNILAGRTASWQSSDTNAAKVSSSGLVSAGNVLGGTPVTATISAKIESKEASLQISVLPVPISTISVTAPSTSMLVGTSQQLAALAKDQLGNTLSGRSFSWTSSDTSILSISTSGIATAKPYYGHLTRTATVFGTSDGKTGTVSLSVIPLPISKLLVTPSSKSLAIGSSQQMIVVALASDERVLSDRIISWSSSDTTTIRISPSGLATAVRPGTATIAASAEGKTATALLEVYIPVAFIQIETAQEPLLLGKQRQLVAVLKDSLGSLLTGREVAWSVSDTAMASITPSGIVTAKRSGSVSVAVASEGRSASALLRLEAPRAKQLDAGSLDACAVSAEGDIVCWGEKASFGQPPVLAAPSIRGSSEYPASCVASLGSACTASTIAVGDAHACAVTSSAALYCWMLRSTSTGEFGQLGTGSLKLSGQVIGDQKFVSVAAGGNTTCAIDSEGNAYCWGSNKVGQVGDGSFTDRIVPTRVSGNLRFLQISVGQDHVCGVTNEKRLYCWGDNSKGQLAVGDNIERAVPTLSLPELSFTSVSAGAKLTCVIANSSRGYCVGSNSYNVLGKEAGQSLNKFANQIVNERLFSSTASSMQGFYACAVTVEGQGNCWGYNYDGQLGTGTVDAGQSYIGNVLIPEKLVRIVAGYDSNFALTEAGEVYAWGKNQSGQLGIAARFDYTPTPRKIIP